MREDNYPVGTTAWYDGSLRTRREDGWYSATGTRMARVGDDVVFDSYTRFTLPAPAPKIELGTVVSAAFSAFKSRGSFVCIKVQDDPAFVVYPDGELQAGDHLSVWALSELSDVTVNGVPYTPKLQEPQNIGAVVIGSNSRTYIRVYDNPYPNPWFDSGENYSLTRQFVDWSAVPDPMIAED